MNDAIIATTAVFTSLSNVCSTLPCQTPSYETASANFRTPTDVVGRVDPEQDFARPMLYYGSPGMRGMNLDRHWLVIDSHQRGVAMWADKRTFLQVRDAQQG